MKFGKKLLLSMMIMIFIVMFMLTIVMNHSFKTLAEDEINNDMTADLYVVKHDFDKEFADMRQFADLLVTRHIFLTLFEEGDAAAMRSLLAEEMMRADVDFVTVVDTDMTVIARANTDISGGTVPFNELVEDALLGYYSISSTEIASLNELISENLDTIAKIKIRSEDEDSEITSAMMQVYLTPVYINDSVAGVLMTGRMLNNMLRIPDDVDCMLKYTTTTIYQKGYCVATNSKAESDVLLGTALPANIVEDLHLDAVSIGEIRRFSTSHVYGAIPIRNYDGMLIGTIVVSSPKEPYIATAEKANQTIIYAFLIVVFFSFIITIYLTKSFTGPLTQLNKSTRYVADKKGYRKVEIHHQHGIWKILGSDEVGEVAGSFNWMIDSLKEKDKKAIEHAEELQQLNESLERRTANLEKRQEKELAYADILTTLSSTIDLNTILTEGLDNILKYTGSPVGAIYMYSSQRKVLVPVVTQGTENVVSKRQFAPGEGIPGQSAVKKEMIVVTDIPADTIYRMEAGLCETPPKTIVSTPLIFKDKLLGVVVTCYLGEVTPDLLNFIQRIVDQHAVAVNNANTYIRTQEMAARLRKQRDELDIKTQELAAASKTKSEFLANMSHELRTPLNSIIGFTEILHDETTGALNEKQAKYVSNVLTSGEHLLQLINDILDLSKVEAGKIELHYQEFPVSAAFDEVKTVVAPLASTKKIAMEAKIDPELTTIYADMGKFKQILYNLLSNAIKFTPEGGSVTIDARRAGDMAQVAVADTGIGISKEDQKKPFQPFVQLDASAARKYGGTGLGLALVKQLVELHGGEVRVESEPGRGSTFTFTIPVKGGIKAPEAAKKPETAADVSEMPEVPAVVETATPEAIGKIEMPEIIEPEGATGDEPLILVVEDDETASELLTFMLTEAGYRVAPACSGRDALAIAGKQKPFAITLDIIMEGMDGWEVLKRLKDSPTTSEIPVVVISIVDEKEIGFVLGVVDYFVKPVEKSALLAALDKLRRTLKVDKPKVLVVDDEPAAVELISSMIEPEGYGVIQAYGGQEGIEKSFSEHPDVLVLDLMMPVISGFDVISRLKASPETGDIPIIICTAKDLTEDDIKLLNDDIVTIMRKGMFTKEYLLDEIEKFAMLEGSG